MSFAFRHSYLLYVSSIFIIKQFCFDLSVMSHLNNACISSSLISYVKCFLNKIEKYRVKTAVRIVPQYIYVFLACTSEETK